MSDGLNAREDVKKAMADYGSSITLRTTGMLLPTDPNFDFTNPENNISTSNDIAVKALVSTETSKSLQNIDPSLLGNYTHVFRFYTDTAFKKDAKIIFEGSELEITYIAKKVLQDVVFMYEVVAG